jgi:tRNA (Thr-GGU) A37 N-methylase
MSKEHFQYASIGVIRTPFESPEGMPIQPVGADAADGTVKLDKSYADGLQDLDGFSHCILLYHFHATADSASLEVEPFLDEKKGESLPRGHHNVRIRSVSPLSKLPLSRVTR